MSINEPKQTKAERREQAREARQQAEADAAKEAARKRRIWQVGGLAGVVAIVAVGVVIATSSGGGSSDLSGTPNGAAEVQRLSQGLPQQGNSIGKPDAPLTLVEFADLKCPVCRDFSVNTLPTILERYVKTGKLRLELKLLHFVGEQINPGDSESAARFSVAAGNQGKQWSFAELFYLNQQDEGTRYVTDEYLTWLAGAIPGLDAQKALKDAKGDAVTKKLEAYKKEFDANAFTGTPSFLIGKTGGTLEQLMPAGGYGDPQAFVTQIEDRLNQLKVK